MNARTRPGTSQPATSTQRRTNGDTREFLQHCLQFISISSGRWLVRRASAGRLMIAPVRFNVSALAVHVSRTRPIGQTVIGPILSPALWRRIKETVDAQELFA